MKKVLLTIMALCCAAQLQLASAQAAELEQLALNIEKLAQLKSILTDMKKGYEIISKGYGTVKDLTQGNFNLHEAFLDGLLAVNPEIRKYRKVPDIIRYQASILSEYRSAFNQFSSGGRFSQKEIDYLSKVYGNLLDRSLENLDELTMVLTASKLRMSDDERLEAIDRLYDDMQEKLSFLRGFNRKASLLDQQRQRKMQELETLKRLYGQ